MANEFKVKKGLVVNGSGSVILDVQGSQGQLFSVTDQLSGSLFSVNDISGMPILAVSSDDSVRLGTFNREAIKVSGSNATITGSFTGSLSGSLFGTASWASNATTASYVLQAVSASFATNAANATSASYVLNAVSASQAATASSADNFLVRGTLTAQTIVAQTITSSTDFVTGSTRFGSLLSDTHQFTGSVSITGSLTLPYLSTGSVLFAGATDNITEDNSNLFWDNTNKRLGIGTNAPARQLEIFNGIGGEQILARFRCFNAAANAGIEFLSSTSTTAQIVGLASNGGLSFRYGTTEGARLTGTGNVLIGTTSDTSERFQVSGSSKFAGDMAITGNTTVQGGLYVQSAANQYLLFTSPTNAAKILHLYWGGATTYGLDIQTNITTQNAVGNGYGVRITNLFNANHTTGAYNELSIGTVYIPTSGTGTYTNLRLGSVVNQSGGANGITRGLYVAPTLTAAADWRSIEWSNNAATAPSASWGLYGAGSAPNYLSGSLGIGTTATGSTLTVLGSSVMSGSLTVITGSNIEFQVLQTGVKLGNAGTDTITVTGSLNVSSSNVAANLRGSGSGVFSIDGTSGRLFQVDDSLTGSLFSVNTAAGLPIIEAFSDNTVRIGQYGRQVLFVSQSRVGIGKESLLNGVLDISGSVIVTGSITATSFTGSFSGSIANAISASYAATASYATNFTIGSTLILDATLTDYASVAASSVGSNNLFSQNTSSYTSAFFKYTCASASNARSGEVVAVWNGATVQFTDFSTVDVGITTAVTSSVSIVTGQVQFNVQTNTSGWAIKSMATFI
jgi:hypothetical protein